MSSPQYNTIQTVFLVRRLHLYTADRGRSQHRKNCAAKEVMNLVRFGAFVRTFVNIIHVNSKLR